MNAMWGKVVFVRGLSVAAALMVLSSGASAAQVSKEFLGTFVIPPQAKGDPLSCGRDNNDGAIEISNSSTAYFEYQCDVSAFRPLKSDPRSAEVLLSCAGEGQTWRTRELWNLQQVESQTMLITTKLQISKPQPERKRGSARMRDDIRVTIYVKCPSAR